MLARHAVLLTPSGNGNRPLWSYRYTCTLPRLISFVCHSYENAGDVRVFFPFWNSLLPARTRHNHCRVANLVAAGLLDWTARIATFRRSHRSCIGIVERTFQPVQEVEAPHFPPSRHITKPFRINAYLSRILLHLSSFRINTSGSVDSKQLYLPLESTLMKNRGRGGRLLLTRNPKKDFYPDRPSGAKDHSSIPKRIHVLRSITMIADSSPVGKDLCFGVPKFGGSDLGTFQRVFGLPPQQILEVSHLVSQQIQFPRQALNLSLGAPVDGVVQLTTHAILHILAVLAHHNDRRLNRREQGQDEIQQDKRIRIPGGLAHAHVDCRVDAAQNEKTNDELPRPAELHHGVRDALGQRRFCFDHFVGVAHRAKPHQLLRRVKLLPQHRQHIHSRMRLALQKRCDVVSADFNAHRILDGRRVGLMRRPLQHGRKSKKLAVRRLIHHDFLLIFVHRRDAYFSGDHHVSLPARLTHLVN